MAYDRITNKEWADQQAWADTRFLIPPANICRRLLFWNSPCSFLRKKKIHNCFPPKCWFPGVNRRQHRALPWVHRLPPGALAAGPELCQAKGKELEPGLGSWGQMIPSHHRSWWQWGQNQNWVLIVERTLLQKILRWAFVHNLNASN